MTIPEYVERFNPAQRKVITAPLGHLLVNAGAGTGKTSTLAARLLYLQAEMGIPSSSIMGVSFSRTARARLLEKAESLSNDINKGSPVPTYTYHGLAFRIVRLATGLQETWLKPGFDVLEPVKGAGNRLFLNSRLYDRLKQPPDPELRAGAFSKVIDLLRMGYNGMDPIVSPEELPEDCLIGSPSENGATISLLSDDIKLVWIVYERLLRQSNTIDYTGLLVEGVRALRHVSSKTLERSCNGLKYILADEYQDTSRLQELLLLTYANQKIYINAVGDRDQTIYTFNGSTITNIDHFGERFSSTGIPVLEPINLTENYRCSPNILHIANHIRKSNAENLRPAYTRNGNLPVQRVLVPRLPLAADFVAHEIKKLISFGVAPSEIAVLVRKNSSFSPQGKEVQDALANIDISSEVAEQKESDERKETKAAIELCQDHLFDSVEDIINDLSNTLNGNELNIDTIKRLLLEAREAGATTGMEAADLLFDNMDQEASPVVNSGNVQVRTVHSSKGEEYRIVFLLYLADGQFPHGKQPDIEEERRLLYVGITRAMERLYIIGHHGTKVDFFGECEVDGTELIHHVAPGGVTEQLDPTLLLDRERMDRMDETLRTQQKAEEAWRKELWRQFEEEEE